MRNNNKFVAEDTSNCTAEATDEFYIDVIKINENSRDEWYENIGDQM